MANLSDHNCTECFKYFEYDKLTVVVIPEEQSLQRLCDGCIEKFKEKTKNEKVCVEVTSDNAILYCYRCGLKTHDKELFKKHDCIKTEASIKFIESLVKDGKNVNTN